MRNQFENHHYNKAFRPYASRLRKEMTKAEACLWKYILRARQLKGYSFKRQRPVIKYIADFMCKELMLIIEVDGVTHHSEEALKEDGIRQKALELAGFTVLRFDDSQILNNISNVHAFLSNWIDQRMKQ